MASTVIRNGTIVTADLTYRADVLIEGGRIVAIGEGLTGDKVLDATGCFVMPGGIDPHTHVAGAGNRPVSIADGNPVMDIFT